MFVGRFDDGDILDSGMQYTGGDAESGSAAADNDDTVVNLGIHVIFLLSGWVWLY
jgi:hypothetical protein